MENQLEDFISQSLKQIINAVIEAQTYAKSVGAKINPPVYANAIGGPAHFQDNERKPGQFIEFDIAVTASKGKNENEKIGVSVLQVGLSKKWFKTLSESNTSRIKFTIPIVLPFQN